MKPPRRPPTLHISSGKIGRMDHMPPRINLPAIPQQDAEPAPPHTPLLPERTDFLEGDAPAAAKVEAFLAGALDATGSNANITGRGPGPLDLRRALSNHSVKAYGRDLMDFVRHMQAQGVDPLHVTADHVKMYKRALLEAGLKSATVARRLSVLAHLPSVGGQGTGLLGNGPGHRRGQGPRRPEELNAVFDREAGNSAFGGDPFRHLAGDPRPGLDECLFLNGLPGLGGGRGLRRAP